MNSGVVGPGVSRLNLNSRQSPLYSKDIEPEVVRRPEMGEGPRYKYGLKIP